MKKGIGGVSTYPHIKIRKTKTGLGLFAMEDIPRGKKILQYIGRKIKTEEADKYPNRYIFEIDDLWSIDGSPRYNIARYFNHSCMPNALSILEGEDRIFIISKRRIKSGEEITFDYGREYINDYIKKSGCKCFQCRKVS